MWRNKKVIMVVVLAAIVLIAGGASLVAYAQTGGTQTTGKTLQARVAAILGIDQAKVEAAFTQAQRDMQNERVDAFLKNQVAQGKMTQAQADQYKAWWLSRPNIPGVGFGGRFGPRHLGPAATQTK